MKRKISGGSSAGSASSSCSSSADRTSCFFVPGLSVSYENSAGRTNARFSPANRPVQRQLGAQYPGAGSGPCFLASWTAHRATSVASSAESVSSSNDGRASAMNALSPVNGSANSAALPSLLSSSPLSYLPNAATAESEANTEVTDTDKMLAKEMNELSVQERNVVYEEIHGVAVAVHETAHLVQTKFRQLDYELKNIAQKPAYERAVFMNPKFVTDHSFRLAFLRCEHFDPRKAAERMVRYFDFKLELFGLDNLVRKITLRDLHDGDMAYLKTGTLAKLPNRDRQGRRCYAVCQKFQEYTTWQNLFRATTYFLEAMFEDEATQKMGSVLILYNVGFDVLIASMLDRQVVSITNQMVDSLYIRSTAVHYCYNDRRLLPALSIAQLALGRNHRLRFRTHFGSDTECQYSLMTFGIDPTGIQVDTSGNRDLSGTFAWLAERQRLEKERQEQHQRQQRAENSGKQSETIEYPLSDDVLMGRGRPFQEWPGNKYLSELVNQHYDSFMESDRSTKTSISKGIVQMIQRKSGRFLKRGKTKIGWIVVTDYAAREKVSHAFRNIKQRNADRVSR